MTQVYFGYVQVHAVMRSKLVDEQCNILLQLLLHMIVECSAVPIYQGQRKILKFLTRNRHFSHRG